MLDSIKALGDFALIKPPEIRCQITRDAAQALDFRIAAARAIVFNFALVAAFQTGVNREIECKIRNVQRHGVINNTGHGFLVLHDGAFQLDVRYAACGCIFAEWSFRLQFFVDGNLLLDGHMVAVGNIFPVTDLRNRAEFLLKCLCKGAAQRFCRCGIAGDVEIAPL